MTKAASLFRYFHSSPENIPLAVVMYARFPLSRRNVEDLLLEQCRASLRYSTRRRYRETIEKFW